MQTNKRGELKRRNDASPAFLTVIPNKSGRLLVTVIEAGGGGGGGGEEGPLASINKNDNK